MQQAPASLDEQITKSAWLETVKGQKAVCRKNHSRFSGKNPRLTLNWPG